MKKYILIAILFVFAAGVANAQVITLKSSAYPANSLDTVTNTATKTLDFGTAAKVVGKHNALVVATVTEISGTTAGSVILEASSDGSNWYSVYSSKDSVYTFSPADQTAAQSFAFQIDNALHSYYRLSYTGVGTMSAKIAGRVVISAIKN